MYMYVCKRPAVFVFFQESPFSDILTADIGTIVNVQCLPF